MRLKLARQSHDAESTIGRLFVDGYPECWTVEDEPRAEKVRGETRIPEGLYQIKLRTVGGFHQRELARYGEAFHKGMLHIQNVPGFEFILIHCGNTEKDTDGCLIVGADPLFNGRGGGKVTGSRSAYEKLYPRVRDAILAGEDVDIEILDD